MTRSLKKGFYVNDKLFAKVEKMNASGDKKVVKVWDRACQIVPEFVGFTFAVHNGKQFVSVYVNEEMIVFDRLIPMNEELKGQRWAYVPSGNTYDAFICWEGYWTLTEDIAPRNEASPESTSKKDKKPELDLLPQK